MAWSGRHAAVPTNQDQLILVRKREALQKQFADLATAVAAFGADPDSVGKLEAIRSELQVVERDLALMQTGLAA